MTTQTRMKPGRKRSPELQALVDRAAANGILANTLLHRIKEGWDPERAVTEQPTKSRPRGRGQADA
ncbi:hypothetical protein ACTHPH_23930 [Paenibacillus pasadenensis]|uniref:Uncharacterized protein n=1 Tax=Paenibacillus albicereus TaxID=2726185 RepID=A0A6H2H0A1_9BACL|nr:MULTISPECIES: hypothetical protein [Paenibacillus]QJC53077.1 hypothetical protein HGI30_16845 [Paenibacillus albicereus]